jgi:histidinol dehydrogenase
MAIVLHASDAGFKDAFRALLVAKRESAAEVDDVVAEIIEDVAARGDDAVIEYTRRFDRMQLSADRLRLSAAEIRVGADTAPSETVAALRIAAERIESFHRRQLPVAIDYVDDAGVRLGQR